MAAIILLLIILALFGSGFAYNALWIVAVVLLIVLIVGYAGFPPASGGPRRWYGRW